MQKTCLMIMLFIPMSIAACAGTLKPAANGRPIDHPVATAPIHFFRSYLSAADGHRCPMTPSCSSYALTSIERHGAVVGWIMAADRLMRCGRDELKHCPSVATRNGRRCRDTVDDNDFWWR